MSNHKHASKFLFKLDVEEFLDDKTPPALSRSSLPHKTLEEAYRKPRDAVRSTPSQKLIDSAIKYHIEIGRSGASWSADMAGDGETGGEAAGEYEDLLPVMARRLEEEQFVQGLCGGFRLLAEAERGVITPESLHRNAAVGLGVEGMTAAEAEAMVREGDMDGDGALNEREFCVLMVRLRPEMMADAEAWIESQLLIMTPSPAGRC